MNNLVKDIIIIGSGPAALTASIYLGRSGIKPYLITGDTPGGQLIKTNTVENYPGFDIAINGTELMTKMINQAEKYNAEFIYETVVTILRTDNNLFEVQLNSNNILLSKCILIATGATHNKLNIPGEAELSNKGVSWCATCDGPMYKDKDVAVIGGGNTAVMEALFLSNFASSVLLIHRRASLRADKMEQDKLFNNKKIQVIWNSEVTEIIGTKYVTSISIYNNINKNVQTKNVNGVFIAIGTIPSSKFAKELVHIDESGYIIASDTKTSCEGIFAAGDVVSNSLKQAIYAAGQGALAATKIEKYLGVR